jgi:hypothetical protein
MRCRKSGRRLEQPRRAPLCAALLSTEELVSPENRGGQIAFAFDFEKVITLPTARFVPGNFAKTAAAPLIYPLLSAVQHTKNALCGMRSEI